MTMVTEALDVSCLHRDAGESTRTEIRTGDPHLYVPSLVLAAVTAWLLWTGLTTLERSHGLWSGLAAGRAELVAPAVVALIALALACERRWPAERRGVLARGHLHDGAFFIFHVVAVVPLMTLLSVAFAQLIVSHARLDRSLMDGRLAPMAATGGHYHTHGCQQLVGTLG